MGRNQPIDNLSRVNVTFYPANLTVAVARGSTLQEAAGLAGVDLEFACNGNGTCGKCKVQCRGGEVTEVTPEERQILRLPELESGYRLACLTRALGDVAVQIEREIDRSGIRIVADGLKPDFQIDAPVRKRYLALEPPSLEDHVPDLERVLREAGRPLAAGNFLGALRSLPAVIRTADFKITAVFKEEELIGVEAGDTTAACYGVALDIGTTTLVLALIALDSGAEIASASAVNAQGKYGQDVISRIQFAGREDGLAQLREAIVQQINDLIAAVCLEAGVSRCNIYELVAAGNTTMVHLLLGVSPDSLARAPYVAAFQEGVSLPARQTGIEISEFGWLYVMPSVSSYVGADIVAGIIATSLQKSERPALLVDIGTNGEIVFGSREGLVACSCAAGPALEGMNISCGTIAVAGAVEKVDIGADVALQTIGGKPPLGICGSGIIDAVAELLRNQISESSGRVRDREAFLAAGGRASLAERIKDDGELRFELAASETGPAGAGSAAKGIYISQKDIRQVQLAKAAIASAIGVLMQEVGAAVAAISAVYVAGAFGKHLRRENLLRTGFIRPELGERIAFVGNTSKTGAAICLLSKEMRREAERVAQKTRYFELSVYPGYDQLFFKAIAFPKEEMGRKTGARSERA